MRQVGGREWIYKCLPLGRRMTAFCAVIAGVLCCLVMAPGAPASIGVATTVSEEKCPDEASPGFRSYLPDCRAYEQVSPVFKDGNALSSEAGIAEDGSHVLAHSLGGIAGSRSDTETHGTEYELSRSASGWGVAAISPPASSFPAQFLTAASPDLGQTLWLARSPSESIAAANFYLRESDGTMVKIGPALPPTATSGPPAGEADYFKYGLQTRYMEASDDLSHVLFEISGTGLNWPGNTTVDGTSLYEYSGSDQVRPELVGVNSEGHLISSCSISLGAGGEQELYNAVSATGASVFFTAAANTCGASEGPGVNELYARIEGFETVSVSEPSAEQCAACATGAEKPATFAGASRDGSKVFFLTEQELLGGSGMSLYEYDFDQPAKEHVIRVASGTPAPAVQGVARVSEDGSHLFFVAGGRLTKGPREGRGGDCVADLTAMEQAEEEVAEKQEEQEEPVTAGAGCRPTEDADNLYVFERDGEYPAGRVAFIATLLPGDAGDWGERDQRDVQATPDGRFLVFQSRANLTPGDTSETRQIFEYDTETEQLVRVSRGSASYGLQGTESANAQGATIQTQSYASELISPAQATSGLAVSNDGSKVLFTSTGALTLDAQATPEAGTRNLYEYSSTVNAGGSIGAGDVYLISADVLTTHEIGLDPSGRDVFFETAMSLVPQDTDTQSDIYDARIDGGFPEFGALPECDGCAGPAVVQLLPQAPSVPSSVAPTRLISPPAVTAKPKAPAETKTDRLTKALKLCSARRHKRVRARCEARARKKYGPRAAKTLAPRSAR